MELFDKKFVYLEWDDSLEGKKVFVADTLPELRRRVDAGDDDFFCTVTKNDGDYPFIVREGVRYALVYYDPNYECKVAYAHGKTIQFKSQYGDKEWVDCGCPAWSETYEYRVKPEDSKCNTCSYQCEPDMPCRTCGDGSNYKPRVIVHGKRRMTNRELARWLARGNGQVKHHASNYTLNTLNAYNVHDDDKECPDYLLIRGWDEEEWHEPEVKE
jgi:hypothetical protein